MHDAAHALALASLVTLIACDKGDAASKTSPSAITERSNVLEPGSAGGTRAPQAGDPRRGAAAKGHGRLVPAGAIGSGASKDEAQCLLRSPLGDPKCRGKKHEKYFHWVCGRALTKSEAIEANIFDRCEAIPPSSDFNLSDLCCD